MSTGAEAPAAGSGRSPFDLPLGEAGATFIEASAGTGKTHALTTLVVRLLVEEGWRLDQILVVTFTRAASDELRDRIRRTIGASIAALQRRMAAVDPRRPATAGDSGSLLDALPADSPARERPEEGSAARGSPVADPQALELLARWEGVAGVDLAEAARRLEAAMHDIDRANVYTIHGFCRRVLADLSFESGFPFGFEVSGGEGEMVAGAVRDFWRRRLYPASMLLVRYAVERRFLPRELTGWILARRAKTELAVIGGDGLREPVEAREAAWCETFEAARAEWRRSRDGFRAEVVDGTWLKRTSYRRPKVVSELAEIEALFAAPEPRLPPEDLFGRYGREALSRACRKGGSLPANPLFDVFERLEVESHELRAACEQWFRWARRELLSEVRDSLSRRVREERRLGYDDLLIELDEAIRSARGAELAKRIRRELPCALIDEYQDTDPVQARIFERIYVPGRASGSGPAGGGSDFESGEPGVMEDLLGADEAKRGRDTETPRQSAGSGPAGQGNDFEFGELGATEDTSGAAEAKRGRDTETPRQSAGSGPAGQGSDFEFGEPGATEDTSGADEAKRGRDTETPRQAAGSGLAGRGSEFEFGEPGVTEDALIGAGETGWGREATEAPEAGDPAGTLFAVGDPKQSIYRFRGADVFAYLAARRSARERLSLDRNWRSAPALVRAVNALFAGADPFVLPEIEYRPVSAAQTGDNPLRVAPDGAERGDGLHALTGPRGEVPPDGGRPGAGPEPAARLRSAVRDDEDGSSADLHPAPRPPGEAPAAGGERGDGPRPATPLDAEVPAGADGLDREEEGALRFWLVPRVESGRLRTKQSMNPIVTGATANEIVRLLTLATGEATTGEATGRRAVLPACAKGEATTSEATIGGEPLTGGDVAVLVRTREQGRRIAEDLRARGVRSIEIGEGSVLDTREAEQLERFLWSLAEPGREARRRGALAGDLFGLDARALLDLGGDDEAWNAWVERFAEWRSEWEAKGIGVVLMRLLEQEGGAARLLRHPDGARRLTNFRHLAELLQEAETGQRLAPAELAAWLSRQRAESAPADDTLQLRLESDEQLVKILTMHGAKGLEFPVVFCPFAWDARGPKETRDAADATYHRDESEDYREVLDLDPDERARGRAWLEEFSESLRLLYVALTRAKYRCVVAWGQVRGAEHAPLAWLLHRNATSASPAGRSDDAVGKDGDPADPDPGVAALDALADRFASLGAEGWQQEVESLARRSPGDVSVAVLDECDATRVSALSPAGEAHPALAAREPRRALRRVRALTSFTALSAERWAAGAGAAGTGGRVTPDGETDPERPDHDQHEEPEGEPGDLARDAAGDARERSAFTFPRGPIAGSCLHRIFEKLDEASPGGAGDTGLDTICHDALDAFGIDRAWTPIARAMVERTRALRLREPGSGEAIEDGGPAGEAVAGEAVANERTASGRGAVREGVGEPEGPRGFRLADPVPRLVELEFCFPVDGLERSRLAARMVEHGYPDPFAPRWESGAGEPPAPPSPAAPPSPPIEGFLRGFVDLVVEERGRWYVIDYKSNWLGPTPRDYAPEALAEAIRAGGYPLQYLIYLVALHRYLATRLPGYDYERHVGGAFYLFVRGADPAAGMRRGVYFDRPSAACLHAIDGCFKRTA